MFAETGMLRMVTSLLGSSPAFLIRSTSTSAGVEPFPDVTMVLPFKSAMVKLGIAVLDRMNPPSPLVSSAKFTSRRSGLASCVNPAASGPISAILELPLTTSVTAACTPQVVFGPAIFRPSCSNAPLRSATYCGA